MIGINVPLRRARSSSSRPPHLGAARQAAVTGPVSLAAGRAALQRLHTEVDGDLPGGAFSYVTAHGCFIPPGYGLPRGPKGTWGWSITAYITRKSKLCVGT